MKNESNAEARLQQLLRSARGEPELPPGFVPAVWRRIEHDELQATDSSGGAWLDWLVERLLTPRIAVAGLAGLLLLGGVAGGLHAASDVRHAAQERYVAAIAPFQQ